MTNHASPSNESSPEATTDPSEPAPEDRRSEPGCLAGCLVTVVLFVAACFALWHWWGGPRVNEEHVRSAVVSTIQKETPASFLVTGQLQTTATATVRNEKVFLPGTLNMSLGTTTSEVRLPGTASYGFEVKALSPKDIELGKNGVVSLRLPPLEVQSVDADLSKVEIKTKTGWARLPESRNRIEQDAMGVAEKALRQQAVDHLQRSTQPRINTAMALRTTLRPVLQSLGIESPRFRIRIGPDTVLEEDRE